MDHFTNKREKVRFSNIFKCLEIHTLSSENTLHISKSLFQGFGVVLFSNLQFNSKLKEFGCFLHQYLIFVHHFNRIDISMTVEEYFCSDTFAFSQIHGFLMVLWQ